MRTIYTTHLFEPRRIELPDEVEIKVNRARQRVFDLLREGIGRPSFEIDLDQSVDPKDSIQHGSYIVKVHSDTGIEDNVHQRVSKALIGHEATGQIKADLGHYCYEGWESAIDNNELLELPNVWFNSMFLDGFLNPEEWEKEKVWSVLEEGHQRALIPVLYRGAQRRVRYYKDNENYKDSIPHWETLASYCRDVWEGERGFSNLIELCERRSKTEFENGGGKERKL